MALRSHLVAIVVMVLAVPWIAISVADDKAPAEPPSSGPAVFSHESHADKLEIAKCTTCHQTKKVSTQKPAPTTRSHAPCLASGCHIDEFLSTGPRTKKEEPANYANAANFCGVCHASKDGAPPSRFAKAKANALFETKDGANYHVEMNHRKHTARTSCSGCHTVDPTSFKLNEAGPGHAECSSCHDAEHEVPMTECATCHSGPGPDKYFTKTRKGSDVRVCDPTSDSKSPCFKHERTEHRFSGSDPLECSSCHFMFKKKSHGGKRYESLADVKAAPMMDNARDLAHKNCGAGGCHKSDVDDSAGKARCGQCHSKKFMSNSLFN